MKIAFPLIAGSEYSTLNLASLKPQKVPKAWALIMHSYHQNAIPDKPLELSLKWESAFQDLLNEIYFKGYAQQLLEENPRDYQTEYYYFISLYDYEPKPIIQTK